MIDEQLRPECHLDPLQQPVGHRRAGEADLPDRAGVGRGEIGMAHEIMVERRDEIEVGHPLAADQPQRRRRIEVRQTDERAVDQRQRQ